MDNKNTWKLLIAIIIILLIVLGIIYIVDFSAIGEKRNVISDDTWRNAKVKVNTDMDIVLSLEDKVSENTTWCGTFNLIWNDLKNDIAKQDIKFTPQLEIVENLNKGTFNTSHISDKSYYKVYGIPSLELKKQIENEIKKKFNETSDILDDFDWTNKDDNDYFLYAMLKKEFEFPKMFTELAKGKFGNYDNVEYFGIDNTTDKIVREQVQVMYYNSIDDFAIKLLTKSNDEVIISKGSKKDTFGEIYNQIIKDSETYEGIGQFGEKDTLKIPNITFNLKKEIKEIEEKPFLFSNGKEYAIEKAMQTVQFSLDKKGGKIKSEAGMMNKDMAMIEPEEPRQFIVNDTFTIFLKEKESTLPYFASKISDITKVQYKNY